MPQDLRNVVQRYDRAQEEEQAAGFASQKGLAYINLVNYPLTADVLALIPEETARQYQIVAFMRLNNVVRVASPDPTRPELAEVMNQIGSQNNITFEPVVCSNTSLDYAYSRYGVLIKAAPAPAASTKAAETARTFDERLATLQGLKAAIEQVSTTELLDTVITGALAMNASDVHLEPMLNGVDIRFRIDGKLLPIVEIPEKNYKYLLSRIKTAAKIKLDVTTAAGDGRMSMTIAGSPLDIRVNAIPSAYGQTIEMRLLTATNFMTLDELGFNEEIKSAILQAIQKPQGLMLFTGPTGSGKTTSLYAVLQLLNTPERKIVTIEDPIEYKIEGLEQVQVDPAAGFDFAQALRAVLRQDPNIIMVGEIRDKETAEIAVDAALTGHLVLSTLHTNSAAASFSRLLQMGVPKYLLSDSISLVVAQRLVRKLCTNCNGAGCELCHQTGYRGRVLIAEHYTPDAKTIELIRREATVSEFEAQFAQSGNQTLLQDGLNKAAQGITTEQEVRSVVG